MQVYIDDVLQYHTSGTSLDATLQMSSGQHHIVVQSWDNTGGIHKRSIHVTVQSEAVVVTAPTPNAVVSSPVKIIATSGGAAKVYATQIYVDDILQYHVSSNAVNASLSMSSGV